MRLNGVVTGNYTYNDANQLISGAVTPTYDANGNETRRPSGRTMAYNAKNQMTGFSASGGTPTPGYRYVDADSTQRTARNGVFFTNTALGVAAERTFDPNAGVIGNTLVTAFTRLPNGTLVGRRSGTSREYYLRDPHGSIVGLVSSSGSRTATYAYDPYGNTLSATGSSAAANRWSYSGGYDDGNGLIKFGTGYYDPALGRWTQKDPLAGSINNPASMNRYAYVGGDPCNYLDTDGYKAFWDTLKCGLKELNPSPIPSSKPGALVEGGAAVGSAGVSAAVYGVAIGGGALAVAVAAPLILLGAGVMGYGFYEVSKRCSDE